MGVSMKSFSLCLMFLLMACCCSAADLPRLKPPDEPSQAKAEALIRNIFKNEYANNDLAARRALAKQLLQQAQDEKAEMVSRFVLFREARNVGASAGDVVTALRAVDAMDKVFAIDPAAFKLPIIQNGGRNIDNQEDAAIYVSAGLAVVDHFLAARDFTAANKALAQMTVVAANMKNRFIITGLRNKVQYVKDAQLESDRSKALLNKPGGELVTGKAACFFEDDWPKGLALLASCTDPKIKAAAASDLDAPKTGDQKMALANAWWEIAQKQTPFAKLKFEGRARHWYGQALADAG